MEGEIHTFFFYYTSNVTVCAYMWGGAYYSVGMEVREELLGIGSLLHVGSEG